MSKLRARLSAQSIPIVLAIDEQIRRYDIRGDYEAFRDVASDVLDGWLLRSELADLVSRRFLSVIHYGFDDSLGPDLNRFRDPRMCGTSWSVDPTERMIRTFWPDRFTSSAPKEPAQP